MQDLLLRAYSGIYVNMSGLKASMPFKMREYVPHAELRI